MRFGAGASALAASDTMMALQKWLKLRLESGDVSSRDLPYLTLLSVLLRDMVPNGFAAHARVEAAIAIFRKEMTLRRREGRTRIPVDMPLVMRLLKKGESIRQIADTLSDGNGGISRETIRRRLKDMKHG